MSTRLHTLLLPASAAAITLCFIEDYSVVAGQTSEGQFLPVICADTQYMVAGALLGVPYLPRLGHEGGRNDFTFPAPVVAIIVATNSPTKPVPVGLFVPPPSPPPVEVPTPSLVGIARGDINNALPEDHFAELEVVFSWDRQVQGKSPERAFIRYSTYNSIETTINVLVNQCVGLTWAAIQTRLGGEGYIRLNSFLAAG